MYGHNVAPFVTIDIAPLHLAVGPAGQVLNGIISAMGLRRDQVYITNILKCRPPNNRQPFHSVPRFPPLQRPLFEDP